MGKKPTTLHELICEVSPKEGKRFAKLKGYRLQIAREGIIHHFRVCKKGKIEYDPAAIREVIDGALKGERVYAEEEANIVD